MCRRLGDSDALRPTLTGARGVTHGLVEGESDRRGVVGDDGERREGSARGEETEDTEDMEEWGPSGARGNDCGNHTGRLCTLSLLNGGGV